MEGFFRRIVESSRDGIWVFDAQGRTVHANERAAELLGRTPQQMATLSVHDVLDDAGRVQWAAHLRRLVEVGPNPKEVECCYRKPDGSPVALLISESAVYDDAGRFVAYVHRLSDDTERRCLLDELSLRRTQLDEAQSLAQVGSWDLDMDTGATTWSRQFHAMLGLNPATDTASTERFLEHVLEQDRPAVEEAVRLVVGGQEELSFDARVRRTDGSVRWVRGLGRVVPSEPGSGRRVSGTVQDISAIKEVELQLLDALVLNMVMQAMATAANAAETLSEALAVTRQELLAHEDWQRAVAFTPTGDPAHPLAPFLLPGDGPELAPDTAEEQTARRVLETGDTVFEETARPQTPMIGFLLALDGEPLLILVITACSPFERHAMLRSMVASVAGQLVRVAERERAAGELAAARDAALEASHLKSEFLTTMSHEIRTPLNGVVGLNELLLRSDLDPHQRRLAEGAQLAGRALLGLINDILDFSKIEAGELELDRTDFAVRAVVDQVVAMVAEQAADKGLRLHVDLAPDVPDRLTGDPTRLGQILSNLVFNAVKFTAAGHVALRGRLVRSDPAGHLLRFEVEDTGIGIDPRDHDRLFEPFRQADVSTTRTYGGTGLGLAICRRLVTAIGGEIAVHSLPNAGSTFWFTGRFGHVAGGSSYDRSAEPVPSLACVGPVKGHVLVAEDNEINQLVALGLLESLGYTAEVASDGEETVRLVAQKRFDAVLMDLQMPRMDGVAATRAIRADPPPGFRLPIIAMTATAVEGERERCLGAGMDDFLTKPVNLHRLEAVLRSHVGHVAAAQPASATRVDRPEAHVAPAPAVLDESRLQELDALGPAAVALVDRAVGNFAGRLPAVFADLRDAVDREDHTLLTAVAHKLRGSALNLGAVRVADLSLTLELLDADAWSTAGPLLLELHEACEDAVAALRRHRVERQAHPLAG